MHFPRLSQEQRKNLVAAVIALVVVGILGAITINVWRNGSASRANRAQAQVTTAASSLTPSASPSLGVPQYDTYEQLDHQLAVEIKDGYPEYYRCGEYPADAVLARKDLKPTVNVLSKLTYDSTRKEYVATNTAGVTTTVVTKRHEISEGDGGGTYRQQIFTFAFGGGVTYYKAVRHNPGATQAGLRWDSTEALWYPTIHPGWQLNVLPDDSTKWEYWIMANNGTCAGDIMTPELWAEFAAAHEERPEYAVTGMRP